MITTFISALVLGVPVYVDKLPANQTIPAFDITVTVRDIRQIDKLEETLPQDLPDWGGRLYIGDDSIALPIRSGDGFKPQGWNMTKKGLTNSLVRIRLAAIEDDPVTDDTVDLHPLKGRTSAEVFYDVNTRDFFIQDVGKYRVFHYIPEVGGPGVWSNGAGDKKRREAVLFFVDVKKKS